MKKDKRVKKRNKQFLHEKELIRCYEELHELRRIQWSAPRFKLEEPRFAGYKKFFVLRADVENRKDAQVFRDILKVINDTVYSKDGTFKRQQRIENTHNYKEVDVHPVLRGLRRHEWDKLNWPAHYKKWFRCAGEYVKLDRHNFSFYMESYRFISPWMFDTKVEKHYITEIPTIYPEVEAKEDEVKKKFEDLGGWDAYLHLKGHKPHWRDEWGMSVDRRHTLDQLNKKEIDEWKREVPEE